MRFAFTTCPPASRNTHTADGCGSRPPGPGATPSPRAGADSAHYPPPPEPGAATPTRPGRHAKLLADTAISVENPSTRSFVVTCNPSPPTVRQHPQVRRGSASGGRRRDVNHDKRVAPSIYRHLPVRAMQVTVGNWYGQTRNVRSGLDVPSQFRLILGVEWRMAG